MRTLSFIILCALSGMIAAQEKYEYRYWFDTADTSACIGASNNREFHIEVDPSPLKAGLHSFHFQTKDAGTGESIVKTAFFYKTAAYSEGNCRLFVDGRLYAEQPISSVESSTIHIDMDATPLPMGIHTLGIQVVDDSGATSSVMASFFMKTVMMQEIKTMNIYYIIDNDPTDKATCTFIDGMVHAELDMENLPDGKHTITFLLANYQGAMTPMETATFLKETSGSDNPNSIRIINNDKILDNAPTYHLDGTNKSIIIPRQIYIQNGKKFIVH